MALLELVHARPDWMGALGVALTRPAGVPERRGERGSVAATAPASGRGASPTTWRGCARRSTSRRATACAAWATPPPSRPGSPRGEAAGAAGPPARAPGARRRRLPAARLSRQRSTTRRSGQPLGEHLAEHAPVAARRFRLEAQQRRARPALELVRELLQRLRRGRLDVRAERGPRLLEPARRGSRGADRAACRAPCGARRRSRARRASRPAASCTCRAGATAGGSGRRSPARRPRTRARAPARAGAAARSRSSRSSAWHHGAR